MQERNPDIILQLLIVRLSQARYTIHQKGRVQITRLNHLNGLTLIQRETLLPANQVRGWNVDRQVNQELYPSKSEADQQE